MVCDLGTCVVENPPLPEPEPETEQTVAPGTPFDYCTQIPADQRSACNECVGRGGEGEYIFTAVGCVQVSGSNLASDLIRLLLGISGGVALVSFLAAAFKFTISRGDSSQIKSAKEMITASITGLFFLIFSVIILEFIGVEILRIPGLGEDSGGAGGGLSNQVSAVPNTVPPGGECSFSFQCATTGNTSQGYKMFMSQCIGGECTEVLRYEIGCVYESNPDEYCREQTGFAQSVCFEFPDGVGNCSMVSGIEDEFQPAQSVPIGGSCLSSYECQRTWATSGHTYTVDSICVEGECSVNIMSSTGCENQSNPDEYCQQISGSEHAYCYSGAGVSQCNLPPERPEMASCENDDACNRIFRVTTGYECVFPGGGFTYPSGVTVGHCQAKE